MLRKDDRPTFARAVWDEFSKLSGEERCMSSQEFYVLSRWMDQEIPLPVILRAFGEFQGRPRVLSAMEGPVSRAYQYWLDAMGARP